MKRLGLSIAAMVIAGASGAAVAKPKPEGPTKPKPKDPPSAKANYDAGSTAVTNDVLDAIAEEMNRGLTRLQINNLPKPYHISYKVTEVEVTDVVASLGQTTTSKTRHFVNLEVRVRVSVEANPFDLDNANYVIQGGEGIDGVAGDNLPITADKRIAQRVAWRVTDAAYKEALIQLDEKKRARQAAGVTASLPSWTPEKAVVSEEPVRVPELETKEKLEERAKKLSATFRGVGHLRGSRVSLTSYLERRWYLTSEGTNVTDTRRASGVLIAANALAPDGQELGQYFIRYGQTAKDLPTDDQLEKEAKRLSTTLAALQKAPVVQGYSGPVLFEGEGAVGVVRYNLAPNLGGTPLPEGLPPKEAKLFGGAFTGKVGMRVLAPSLSIVDDPTTPTVKGVKGSMIGGYKLDDEGVASQRVQVVKGGKLLSLLTSRTPSTKGAKSNGHARRTTAGGMFHGTATNLIITGSGGLDRKALKSRLIAAAKGDGPGYGIIVRQFDDAAITSVPEYSRRELLQQLGSADQDLPPPTLLAYKVHPSGKEELVRGAQLAEIPIKAWKDIIAVGKQPILYNYLAAPESQLELKIGGGADEGAVPSSGIESAIVTPDLLFKELDLSASTTGLHAGPAIPPPPAK